MDMNKQKWGADYIWMKLKEFKKIFDDENPSAPSTDYEDYQRGNNAQNMDIRRRDPQNPVRFFVKVEPKDVMSVDLTKD